MIDPDYLFYYLDIIYSGYKRANASIKGLYKSIDSRINGPSFSSLSDPYSEEYDIPEIYAPDHVSSKYKHKHFKWSIYSFSRVNKIKDIAECLLFFTPNLDMNSVLLSITTDGAATNPIIYLKIYLKSIYNDLFNESVIIKPKNKDNNNNKIFYCYIDTVFIIILKNNLFNPLNFQLLDVMLEYYCCNILLHVLL
jgi:hypothetical protein